jgi:anti-sigma factor RsiW
MRCEEARPLLEAYVDGELEAAAREQLRAHLALCPECEAEAAALLRLAAAFRAAAPTHPMPEAVRARIRTAVRREAAASEPAAAPAWRAVAYAASLLLAVALGSSGTWLILGEHQESRIDGEIIDSHLRSLLADHLTDVPSSDQHTVKPWFEGKSALSPPAVDLTAEGFPLVGGRLDLIAGKPVPALVYRFKKHVINVFVMPAQPAKRGESTSREGYNLLHWTQGDLGLWAVSDAAPEVLARLERSFRAATGG